MFTVVAAVCGLVLLWSTALSHTVPDLLAPSIGDVQLVISPEGKVGGSVRGTVQIYYDDGVHGPRWGYVCKSSALRSTAQVVCRQLGYSGGDLNVHEAQPQENEATELLQPTTDHVQVEGGASSGDAPPMDNSSIPVWLSGIDCGENNNLSHILRCSHNVSRVYPGSCQQHLIVTCNHPLPEPYNGQVRLCAPATFHNDTQSTSFGVAQVYLKVHGGGWGGVNQHNMSVPLGSYEADSICRQLGYTNAVASYTMTVESVNRTQPLDFGPCARRPNTQNAWFKTDDSTLKCERSQDCFGCCFTYPSENRILCSSSDCIFNKDVVVKCEFDPTIADDVKGGSAELCEFNHDQLSSRACSRPQDWKRMFIITVGAVGSLALVLFCVLLMIAIGCCVYCVRRRHNGRRDRDGRGQQRLLRQQDDEN